MSNTGSSIKYDMEKSDREKQFKKIEKQLSRFPKEIIPLGNADKDGWYEKWDVGRDLLNVPHPVRICLFGKPHTGKTNYLKNVLIRAFPPFERVVVIHCAKGSTKEYDDLGKNVEMLSEIPEPLFWKDNKKKTMVICDDLDFKSANKDQRKNLSRLVGYCSSHHNLSVAVTQQDYAETPPIVRRCANFFVIWSSHDSGSMSHLARKAGMKSTDLRTIFETICNKHRDSLTIDLTEGSPAKFRKNGYEVLERIEGEDAEKERIKNDSFVKK